MGKLIIEIASKGHFLTQIPQPACWGREKKEVTYEKYAAAEGYHNPRSNPEVESNSAREKATPNERTDTERLRNKSNFILGSDFNTELAKFDNRT